MKTCNTIRLFLVLKTTILLQILEKFFKKIGKIAKKNT